MADEKTEIVVEKKLKPVEVPHDAPTSAEPDLSSFQSMLGIQEPNTQEKDQLKTIYEWVYSKTEVKSMPSLMMALRGFENRLSAPKLGETRLGKLYHYVKAQKTVEEAEKWRNSMLS